jgi:hypothetical protein
VGLFVRRGGRGDKKVLVTDLQLRLKTLLSHWNEETNVSVLIYSNKAFLNSSETTRIEFKVRTFPETNVALLLDGARYTTSYFRHQSR